MKNKKIVVSVLIISLLFFFGSVAGATVASIIRNPAEEDTTEFSATVVHVEIKKVGRDERSIICTEEYGDKLMLPNSRLAIDSDDLSGLEAGETVFVRIDNVWWDQFEEARVMYILALRTAEKEIVSLSDYCEYMDAQYSKARLTAMLLGPLFLLVSIHCVLLLKGVDAFRKFRRFK